MFAEPRNEHHWLQRLIGDWSYKSEVSMGPDKPPCESTGTESVRSIGGLWVTCEGECQMPDGNSGTTVMTLGYDSQKQQYVGTWIGSMMTNLWVYEGQVDADGKVLTLEAEGPDCMGEGKIGKYRDVIEFISDDHRVMTSHALGEDGTWNHFLTSHYRRTN